MRNFLKETGSNGHSNGNDWVFSLIDVFLAGHYGVEDYRMSGSNLLFQR
jgi:hypothetical protein